MKSGLMQSHQPDFYLSTLSAFVTERKSSAPWEQNTPAYSEEQCCMGAKHPCPQWRTVFHGSTTPLLTVKNSLPWEHNTHCPLQMGIPDPSSSLWSKLKFHLLTMLVMPVARECKHSLPRKFQWSDTCSGSGSGNLSFIPAFPLHSVCQFPSSWAKIFYKTQKRKIIPGQYMKSSLFIFFTVLR